MRSEGISLRIAALFGGGRSAVCWTGPFQLDRLIVADTSVGLSSIKRLAYCSWIVGDDKQQHTGRLFGLPSMLFPIAHGGRAKPKAKGKRLLTQTKAVSNSPYVHILWDMGDKTICSFPARIGTRLANALEDTITCVRHRGVLLVDNPLPN
jgi:hypothetical protein